MNDYGVIKAVRLNQYQDSLLLKEQLNRANKQKKIVTQSELIREALEKTYGGK